MTTMRFSLTWFAIVFFLLGFHQSRSVEAQNSNKVIVEDVFGKILNDSDITLVDWDGYIANPAIKVFLKPPTSARFPATVVLTTTEPRLYFNLPSDAGPNGPRKSITFDDSSAKVPVYISIFPDRDTNDENHPLNIQFTDANGAQNSTVINLHVIDQDTNQPSPFIITIDFSKDQTGFFNDPQKRELIRQVAVDWAYFIDDMNLDSVPAGAETTFIWNPNGFVSGTNTTNTNAYKGFLLYVYGIHSSALRSGGEGSHNGGFQTSVGIQLPLKRSGGLEVETQGNFNTLGWYLAIGDNDWWKASNLGNEQNDLYSISHHEMGHALFFNPAYPIFAQSKTKGFIEDAALLAYHGVYPKIDNADHFNGEIDNASKKGAFGYEYFGDVPPRRWLITNLDLLSVQAIGYKIRPTFALSVLNSILPPGNRSMAYSVILQAKGGIPPYNWIIESGLLPNGLTLNSDTGTISGTPAGIGTFNFTVRLRDHTEGTSGISFPASIRVNGVSTDPVINSAAFDGKKKLIIQGSGFGNVTRVMINNNNRTDFITSASDTLIKLKGKMKKLGLKSGDNSVQVINSAGAASNVFILKI